MKITEDDEYIHQVASSPLWREGYHFNGYDHQRKIGISISFGIMPHTGRIEEIVVLHTDPVLLFFSITESSQKSLHGRNIRMMPEIPLEKWNLHVEGTFTDTAHSQWETTLVDVSLDLYFIADCPPFGYSTTGGFRYEQPGCLYGETLIGNKCTTFQGKGMRDHSWETRNISTWGEWYIIMGEIIPGWFLSCAWLGQDGKPQCHGWLKKDAYREIGKMEIHPRFSHEALESCAVFIETQHDIISFSARPLTTISLNSNTVSPVKSIQESLVHFLPGEGYGFMWYQL